MNVNTTASFDINGTNVEFDLDFDVDINTDEIADDVIGAYAFNDAVREIADEAVRDIDADDIVNNAYSFSDLETKVDSLESQVEDLEGGDSVEELTTRIESLERDEIDGNALIERVAALEELVAKLTTVFVGHGYNAEPIPHEPSTDVQDIVQGGDSDTQVPTSDVAITPWGI